MALYLPFSTLVYVLQTLKLWTVVLKQGNSPTKDVDGKQEKLQKLLLQKANRNEQYDDLIEEIYKLREEKQ